MRTIKSLLVITLMLTGITMNSQTLSLKQIEKDNNEVEVLTMEERSDVQLWYHNEIQKMNLDEETLNEYESILLMYTSKMNRLDDKDKDFTYEEILVKLDELVVKLNNSIKTILTKESFEIHKNNMDNLINYIKLKMNDENYLVKI